MGLFLAERHQSAQGEVTSASLAACGGVFAAVDRWEVWSLVTVPFWPFCSGHQQGSAEGNGAWPTSCSVASCGQRLQVRKARASIFPWSFHAFSPRSRGCPPPPFAALWRRRAGIGLIANRLYRYRLLAGRRTAAPHPAGSASSRSSLSAPSRHSRAKAPIPVVSNTQSVKFKRSQARNGKLKRRH